MRATFRLTSSFALALLGATSAFAETHAVLPGNSIQAKIDLAVAGDIVAIFGGIYNEDLAINKAIRLVEVNGQEVTITGSVTFSGVTDCPPFDGFTVGSSAKGMTITDTTGLIISNLDARAGTGLTTTGTSNPKIQGSQLSHLTVSDASLEISNSSLTGNINQTGGSLHVTACTVAGDFGTDDAALKTVAFRVTVTGDCIWRSNRAWFGYGKARFFGHFGANAKVVVVGSEIDRVNGEADGIQLWGAGTQSLVCNSIVQNVRSDHTGAENCIDVQGAGASARIFNNYLQKTHSSSDSGMHHILMVSGPTDVVFANNITSNGVDGIAAAPFGVLITNNHAVNGLTGVISGVVSVDSTTGNPLFVDNNPYQLGEGSPGIDAGTPDPRYNDRDGTRNDIGPSGGAWFDPDGWTTENPVVISFDLSPEQVLEGVDTEVILDEGQAVSAP